MKRIVRLVQATDQETGTVNYQDGLQAMWEARWARLGKGGRADWFRSHGAVPPALCPLLVPAPLKVTVRLPLGGSQTTPAGRLLARIRIAIQSRKGRI